MHSSETQEMIDIQIEQDNINRLYSSKTVCAPSLNSKDNVDSSNQNSENEVKTILDFSDVSEPVQHISNENLSSFTVDNNARECEVNKDIFLEMKSSDRVIYHGPGGQEEESFTDPSDIGCDHIVDEETLNSIDLRVESPSSDTENVISESNNSQLKEDASDEGVIPFDERPLRRLKFPKPDSYDHKDLAEFISLRLVNLGYCIVDDVFTEDIIDGVRCEIRQLNESQCLQTGQLAGGRTSGDDSQKVTETEIRSDLIKWIDGNEESLPNARTVLTTMDSIVNYINNSYMKPYGYIKGRTKVGLLFFSNCTTKISYALQRKLSLYIYFYSF